MFDDLKTYGIISVSIVLILGYFVYMMYRDIMILKNEVKELKEFFDTENEDTSVYDEEDDNEDVIYTDIDEYFSHINNIEEQLPVIEEVPEEVSEEVHEDKPKKKKQKKQKKAEESITISPNYEAVSTDI